MNATAPPARLKVRYLDEIRPALLERFGYSSVMQAPMLQKITVNMGVGMAKQDSKVLKAATEQLATIAGQRPSVRRARKSIAAFKLREGMPVGVAVTLRSERGYEFLDRLVSIAIPRIRDFRGLNPRSFDGRGNSSLGVREQIIFPEIDYDAVDEVRGLDITITTTAATDAEAFALLSALGLPFAAQGRPRGFDQLGGEPDDGQADDSPESSSQAPPPAEPEQAEEDEPPQVGKADAKQGDDEPTDAVDATPQDAAAREGDGETPQDAAGEPQDDADDASEGEAAQGEPDADASETDEQGETDKQGETADGEESD